MKNKYKVGLALGVTAMVALTLGVTQGDSLKGAFGIGSIKTDSNPTIIQTKNAETNASLAMNSAKTKRDASQTYATEAKNALAQARTAYRSKNKSALSTAKTTASTAASNATTASNSAQSYADNVYDYYLTAQADFDAVQAEEEVLAEVVISTNSENLDAQEALDLAQEEYDSKMAALEWCYTNDECNNNFLTTYTNNLEEAEEALADAEATAEATQETWADAVADYTEFYTGTYSDAKDTRDTIQDYSEQAQEYADQAQEYADEANASSTTANALSL